MKLIAIFATTETGAFGIDGGLPWGRSAPDDLQFFKNMTMGSVMIMGKNTFPSVVHLHGRDKIVITNNSNLKAPAGTYFVPTIEEALKKAESLGHKEAYLIGGAMLLRSCAHLADEVLWSRIPGHYNADIYLDVDKIIKGRTLEDSNTLPDGTKVHIFSEAMDVPVTNKTALEEALDREQKTTFGNIPVKENLEYVPSEAKENAMDITKQMIRGQS